MVFLILSFSDFSPVNLTLFLWGQIYVTVFNVWWDVGKCGVFRGYSHVVCKRSVLDAFTCVLFWGGANGDLANKILVEVLRGGIFTGIIFVIYYWVLVWLFVFSPVETSLEDRVEFFKNYDCFLEIYIPTLLGGIVVCSLGRFWLTKDVA